MKTEFDSLFEKLDPPRGGVERLRRRLAGEPSRAPSPGFGWAGAASLAAIAALALILFEALEPPPNDGDVAIVWSTPELDALLGRGPLAPALSVKVDDRDVRTEELPSTDPKVRIYRLL